MADSLTQTPIFYEALAAVAVCSPADAAEHFEALAKSHYRQDNLIGRFLDEYVVRAAATDG